MTELIAAYTKLNSPYPGYVNVKSDGAGGVVLTVRADPESRAGGFICGFPSQKGEYGRCTPGDENCNNYCNSAPEKGPMQPAPKPCTQVFEGATATVTLSVEEWCELLGEIGAQGNGGSSRGS